MEQLSYPAIAWAHSLRGIDWDVRCLELLASTGAKIGDQHYTEAIRLTARLAKLALALHDLRIDPPPDFPPMEFTALERTQLS